MNTTYQLSSFRVGPLLGEGRFGKVYIALYKNPSFICALKVITRHSIVRDQSLPMIKREIELQTKIRNHTSW